MEQRDEDLVVRVAEGDLASLRELYDRYRVRLMTYASYVLGDRGRAEDVLQETFIRVYRNAWRFESSRRFSPWVYALTANLCRDELRKRLRRPDVMAPVALEDVVRTLPGTSVPASRDAAAREFAERLRAELETLPPEQREVIVLRFLDGMKYAEIARVVGRPVGTVQSRLHAALKALRERLADCAP